MKIKTVAGLCKRSLNIVIMEKPTRSGGIEQWIGDGYATYPILGLPCLDKKNIFTIFDVPEEQRDKYNFRQGELPQKMNFSDNDETERVIDVEKISFIAKGHTLKPLQTRSGLVFIDAKYLTPLARMGEPLELYERVTDSGQTYIVAKAGLILMAVIMPYDLINDEFATQLRRLSCQCDVSLSSKREQQTKNRAMQCTVEGIECDPNTGEVIEEQNETEIEK